MQYDNLLLTNTVAPSRHVACIGFILLPDKHSVVLQKASARIGCVVRGIAYMAENMCLTHSSEWPLHLQVRKRDGLTAANYQSGYGLLFAVQPAPGKVSSIKQLHGLAIATETTPPQGYPKVRLSVSFFTEAK